MALGEKQMNDNDRVEVVAKAIYVISPRFEWTGSDMTTYSPVAWEHLDSIDSDEFLDFALAAIAALDIDRVERDAYKRGWNEASKEASEEIRDIERQARWEAQDAYHQGQSDGRDW